MKLHGLVPNFYIHVSVSDLCIPMIGPRQTDPGNIYIAHRLHECGNWETENYNSVLKIMRPHSFISGNTSIETRHLLDSHMPFICSVYKTLYSLSHRYWERTLYSKYCERFSVVFSRQVLPLGSESRDCNWFGLVAWTDGFWPQSPDILHLMSIQCNVLKQRKLFL